MKANFLFVIYTIYPKNYYWPRKHSSCNKQKTNKLVLFFGEGDGYSLQYSCLENPMDGGAW